LPAQKRFFGAFEQRDGYRVAKFCQVALKSAEFFEDLHGAAGLV
jgi:hypothetical protein